MTQRNFLNAFQHRNKTILGQLGDGHLGDGLLGDGHLGDGHLGDVKSVG